MDEAAQDVLACMKLPKKEHNGKLHSADPIERFHVEIAQMVPLVTSTDVE